MRWQPIDIISDEYADDNRHWSAQHCVNYLPVPAERPGTRSRWQLRQAPGLKPLVKIIAEHGSPDVEAGPIRGMREVEGKLFVVAGTTLYQITSNLVAVPYGTIPGVGRVSMAHNQRGLGNELLIATGAAGYVFNTNTLILQKITDEAYPGAFVAAYIDSYIAQVEPQGRYWFHSDLADALSYNSLDRYEAEGQPDRIISLHVSHREVLIFGRETIEPYVNDPSGDGTAPFQRANNTVVECGCAARFSVASLDNSVLFLDDKRIVRRLDGYTPVRISTQPIEQALAECSADQIASAFAFVWEDRGHKVYYLTVPGRFTFGFDVLSQRWHRRMTKGMDRWRLSDLVYWNGKWVGGDYQAGRLYELDWKYALDGQDSEGQPLEYVRRSGSGYLNANENRLRVDGCALVCRVGGEITVPVEFPDQPEGPSITGDAPGGSIGQAYSFSYTVTGGTGAKRVTLRSGTLPPGVTLSQTGVLSGTPTESGSFSFVVRATDENGLFDDLGDQIGIVLPMILSANLGVSNAFIIPSADGVDWDSAPINSDPANKFWLLGIEGGRYFGNGSGSNTPARYSDDGGHTWTNTASNVLQGVGMCYAGGRLLLGAYVDGMKVSVDRGETFSTTSHMAGRVANLKYNSPVVCALSGGQSGPGVYHSNDAGVTFGPSTPHGMDFTTGGIIGSDGVDFYLGAQIGGNPALKKYTTGGILTTETLPVLSAGHVVAFGANDSIKIMVTSARQICVNDGDGWELLPTTFSHSCNQIYWNGVVFIAPTGGSSAPGAMYVSFDGRNWSISPMAGAYTPNTVAQEAPDE